MNCIKALTAGFIILLFWGCGETLHKEEGADKSLSFSGMSEGKISSREKRSDVIASKSSDEANVVSLYQGRLSIALPDGLNKIEQEQIALKYAGRAKPDFMFGNEKLSVVLAFTVREIPSEIPDIKLLKSQIDREFSAARVGDYTSSINSINGHDYVVSTFKSDAVNSKLFNYMLFRNDRRQLLVCSFNCTEDLEPDWKNKGIMSLQTLQYQ